MLIFGLDIETTGLEQEKGHRIIEIAMVGFDVETRKPKGAYVKRINPARAIDPKAQAVHGISLADLAGEPAWEAIAPDIYKLLNAADYVVAHNGNRFDLPFIAMELMRVGQPIPNVTPIDTLDARWATPDGKMPKLQELCWAFDVDYDPAKAHGARYDVDVMMQCFWIGLDRGLFSLPVIAGTP